MDAVGEAILELRRRHVDSLAKQTQAGGEGTANLNRELIMWLKSCQYYGVAPPAELVVLLAQQLKVDGKIRDQTHKEKQLEIAVIARALDPELSDKRLARLCAVARKTIGEWKKEPSFNLQVAMFRNIFARMTEDERDAALKEMDFPWQLQQKLSHSPHQYTRFRDYAPPIEL
jgi:hypothetical protein